MKTMATMLTTIRIMVSIKLRLTGLRGGVAGAGSGVEVTAADPKFGTVPGADGPNGCGATGATTLPLGMSRGSGMAPWATSSGFTGALAGVVPGCAG